MSFTLTYKNIRSGDFISAMRTLIDVRSVNNKTAINITKIYKLIEAELEILNDRYFKICEDHLEKDDAGKTIPAPGLPPGSFKIKAGEAPLLDKKIEEFNAEVFQCDRPKIKLKEVIHALSPKEVMALEDLWEPYDEASL